MTVVEAALLEYKKVLCMHGYHIYKDIWETTVGETLVWILKPENTHDQNALAVEKHRTVISHLPQKVSHVC